MKEPRPEPGTRGAQDRGATRPVRVETTIHAGRKTRRRDWVDTLGVDRVPGPARARRAR